MGDQSIFGDLENLVSPFCYSPETPLPDAHRPSVPNNVYMQGFISEDCKWGCFYNEGTIQCFPVDTKISDYHYAPKSHVNLAIPVTPYLLPPSCVITCSCELALHKQRPWVGGVRRILLGLDCTSVAAHYNENGGAGALAIYDQIQQQIVKWIPLPEPVTSVKVVSHFESGDSMKPFFNGAMMAMVGIAAVGMKGGQVLVLDLGLDKTEFMPSSRIVLFSSISTPKQAKPFVTVKVDPFERQIATNRHNAIRNNQLISLTIGDPANFESEDTFIYSHPNGIEIARFDKEDVIVTGLEYVSNIGYLLVGFSFGGFQLWRVDDLSLQYSSNLPENDASVLSFGFQQPIDDPKNFCYIWVLYGAQTHQRSQSKLDLYQLFFLEKPHIENFGCIYQTLQKCAKNLSITLEDVYLPRSSVDAAEEIEDDPERYLVYPLRLWIKNELVFITWKVARSELFYVGIFDLNQWYSSHTSARIPSVGLCPFWVTIPVERPKSEGSIPWDFRLVPQSLQRWENQYKQADIHFYPASVTFQGVCLTTRGYYAFEHFGIQEKMVRLILKEGHSLMAEPALLRQFCYSYGLQPATSSIYEPELLSEKDIDRFYIFTAILEAKRPSLIVKMANAWLDGSFTNVGCTIDLIIDWVRNLSLAVRYLAEQHWDNVFNLTAENMLPETKKFIVYSNFIWNSLHALLNVLIRHDEVYNVTRIPRLNDLRFSLEKLVQYSAAILMFYQADILPTKNVTIDSMVEYHAQRRTVVKQAIANCDIIPEDVKKNCHYLVIDQMISALGEDFVRQEWNLDPTDALYPPRHAGYVVNMIMWRDKDLKLISRVLFYFIMDFISAAGLPSSILKGDFASVIHLNGEEQHEIINMWHVDHGYFDDPLTYVAQSPKFNGRDEGAASWSAALTIMTAFKSGDVIADLMNSGCPPLLGKLYINVLGHHKLLYQKLMNDLCKSSIMIEPDLLEYFFKVALEKGFLHEFIDKKLLQAPEPIPTALITFLDKSSGFEHQSLLLTYYIKVENIDKANQVSTNMKAFWGDGILLSSKQKEVWIKLQKMISSPDMVKKENVVMEFLKMKRQREVTKPPAPMISVKPRRIINLAEPFLSLKAKKSTNEEPYPMSPLRRYVPKQQLLSESSPVPDSVLNRSADDDGASSPQPRRSIGFDVDAILKTPALDHRRNAKRRETAEVAGDSSLYKTPPPVDDSEMHSILKKSDRSTRIKSVHKTRFIDPASGEEITTPEDNGPLDSFNTASYPIPALVFDDSLVASMPIDEDANTRPSPVPMAEVDGDDEMVTHVSDKFSRSGSTTIAKNSALLLPPTENENQEDLNMSTAESHESFVDATGHSMEFDLEADQPENIEQDAQSGRQVELLESSEGIPQVFSSANVIPCESALVDEGTTVSEASVSAFEKNLDSGEDIDLSVSKDDEFVDVSASKDDEFVDVSASKDDELVGLSASKDDELVGLSASKNDEFVDLSAPKDEFVELPVSGDEIFDLPESKDEDTSEKDLKLEKVSNEIEEAENRPDAAEISEEGVVPSEEIEEINQGNTLVAPPAICNSPPPITELDSSSYSTPESAKKSFERIESDIVVPETPVTSKTIRIDTECVDESVEMTTPNAHDIALQADSSTEEVEAAEVSSMVDVSVEPGVSYSEDVSTTQAIDESNLSFVDQSIMEKTAENLNLEPRRLTRRQKSVLESRYGQELFNTMGKADLTPPKASPSKEKSPSRSGGRSKRGKSEDAVSVSSTGSKPRTQKRRARCSETPESDASETSERILTRSQAKKLQAEDLERSLTDSQCSGSQADSQESGRSTRARSRVKSVVNILPALEEAERTEQGDNENKTDSIEQLVEKKTKSRRSSASSSGSSRAQSEPPGSSLRLFGTPSKRGRKVCNYAPDLSTVVETSDTTLMPNTPREARYKRRRPSGVESESHPEEDEDEDEQDIFDASTSFTTKRTRRSVTPSSSSQASDIVTPTKPRRKRHSSSSK